MMILGWSQKSSHSSTTLTLTSTKSTQILKLKDSFHRLYQPSRLSTTDLAWKEKWNEMKQKGLDQCETIEGLKQVVSPTATKCFFATLAHQLFTEIPYLTSQFQFEEYNDDVVLMITNEPEPWQTVTGKTPHATSSKFHTPATSEPSSSNNPYHILNENADDDNDDSATPSQILSHKFDKSTDSPNKTDSDNSTTSHLQPPSVPSSVDFQDAFTLTKAQYEKIVELIHLGKQDDISVSDYEKYISMNITKAKTDFEAEVEEMTTKTSKNLSHHKNILQQELDKRVTKLQQSTKEVERKVDKVKLDIKKEEENCITYIAATGNATIASIKEQVQIAKSAESKLQDISKFSAEITSSVAVTSEKINSTITTGYQSFYRDVRDTIDDNKEEFSEWASRRVQKIYNREDSLIELIREQKETIHNQNSSLPTSQQELQHWKKQVLSNLVHLQLHRQPSSKRNVMIHQAHHLYHLSLHPSPLLHHQVSYYQNYFHLQHSINQKKLKQNLNMEIK